MNKAQLDKNINTSDLQWAIEEVQNILSHIEQINHRIRVHKEGRNVSDEDLVVLSWMDMRSNFTQQLIKLLTHFNLDMRLVHHRQNKSHQ